MTPKRTLPLAAAVLAGFAAVLWRMSRSAPRVPAEGVVSAHDLSHLTRDELYERARTVDLPGRSRMNKAELQRALSIRPNG